MTRQRVSRRLALGLAAAAMLAPFAATAADSPFAGKTLTVIAGYRPGGGIDGMARLIARHIGRSIPGNPETVVKNIGGAAGNVAANHLYVKAEPDGLTLATPGRTWMLSKLFNEPGVRFDALKFTFIGSTGGVNNMLWVRSDLGIRTVEDLKNSKKKLVFGSLNLRSTNGIVPRILNKEGWPLDALPGYKATSNIMLALEQKEVDGFFFSEGTMRSNRGDLIDDKVIVPLLQSQRMVAGMPVLEDLVSEKNKALLKLGTSSDDVGVPLIGPPGIPADRTAMLQKAFLAMCADPAFIADAKKLGLETGNPISGPDVQATIANTVKGASPEVVKLFQEYTAPPGGTKKN